jgi:hypothetical protein
MERSHDVYDAVDGTSGSTSDPVRVSEVGGGVDDECPSA